MIEIINYPENRGICCQFLEIKQYPIHYHSDGQLIYVYEGEIELKLTYANYHLKEGDFHYIHPFDTHSIKSITGNNKILLLSIQLEFSCKYFPAFENQIFFIKTDASVTGKKLYDSLLFLVQSIVYNASNGNDSICNRDTVKLLKMLSDNFREFVINKDKGLFDYKISFNQQHSDLVNRIITYIYENYQQNLTLTQIADNENINSYYLSHLFQHMAGENFRSFLAMVRVEMSEHLLLETTYSVSKIALEVGFSNPKYYVEHFKVWFGYHPKEYRRIYSNEILGKKPPIVNVLDINDFNIAVQNNSSYNNPSSLIYITLDLKEKHDYDTKKTAYAFFANNLGMENSLLQDISELNFSKLYFNYIGNQNCIDLLNNIIEFGVVPTDKIHIYDTIKSLTGMFTVNGLEKPLFHFLNFMPQICTAIIEKNPNYIISKYNGDFCITLVNDSEYLEANFQITFTNLNSNYKITKYLLAEKDSCFAFWNQLNFINNISKEEKAEIDAMSKPRISFSMLPAGIKQQYQMTLLAKDIVVLKISPITV